MGQQAVDGRYVRVLPEPQFHALRPANPGWPTGSDTRAREGRSSTAGVQLPSGVQKMVGVSPLRVLRASSLVQTFTATTTWAEGSTSWSGVIVEGAVADAEITVLPA